MPDNKITANVDCWGKIDGFTVESQDADFILAAIKKLKPALPTFGPTSKTTPEQNQPQPQH